MKAILLVVVVILLASCGRAPAPAPETLPEVNEANCSLERINSLRDPAIKQQFAAACARRGTYQPSAPRTW